MNSRDSMNLLKYNRNLIPYNLSHTLIPPSNPFCFFFTGRFLTGRFLTERLFTGGLLTEKLLTERQKSVRSIITPFHFSKRNYSDSMDLIEEYEENGIFQNLLKKKDLFSPEVKKLSFNHDQTNISYNLSHEPQSKASPKELKENTVEIFIKYQNQRSTVSLGLSSKILERLSSKILERLSYEIPGRLSYGIPEIIANGALEEDRDLYNEYNEPPYAVEKAFLDNCTMYDVTLQKDTKAEINPPYLTEKEQTFSTMTIIYKVGRYLAQVGLEKRSKERSKVRVCFYKKKENKPVYSHSVKKDSVKEKFSFSFNLTYLVTKELSSNKDLFNEDSVKKDSVKEKFSFLFNPIYSVKKYYSILARIFVLMFLFEIPTSVTILVKIFRIRTVCKVKKLL